MKRWIIGGVTFVSLSMAAFTLVVAADRKLGVAAPYSLLLAPLALSSISAAGIAWGLTRRPTPARASLKILPALKAPARPPDRPARRRNPVEGVLLLRAAKTRSAERAA